MRGWARAREPTGYPTVGVPQASNDSKDEGNSSKMNQPDWLAERFEQNRGHLRAVAYRMLGSLVEADDAVQETWLRLSRSDSSEIENLGGWLTTVVARVCLDMLRSRTSAAKTRSIRKHPNRLSGTKGNSTRNRRQCWPTRWDSHCWWCSIVLPRPSG